MKTVIYERYGAPGVLHTGEAEAPVPGDKEVLIRVRAAAVNYGDLTARNFGNITPRSFNMPSSSALMKTATLR